MSLYDDSRRSPTPPPVHLLREHDARSRRVAWALAVSGAVALVLVTHCRDCQAAPQYAPPASPLAPASGEAFVATSAWRAVEPLAWSVATAAGMRGAERAMLLSMVWSESRGRPLLVGDHGCSVGLTQLGLGGLDDRGRRCPSDVRRALSPELARLPRDAFLDPATNLHAAVAYLRVLGSREEPWRALTRYAGCLKWDGICARGGLDASGKWQRGILQLHAHWLVSGLAKRIMALEAQERPGVGLMPPDPLRQNEVSYSADGTQTRTRRTR